MTDAKIFYGHNKEYFRNPLKGFIERTKFSGIHNTFNGRVTQWYEKIVKIPKIYYIQMIPSAFISVERSSSLISMTSFYITIALTRYDMTRSMIQSTHLKQSVLKGE